jgi:hypothetical protein
VKSRRPTHQLVGDFKNNGRELRRRGDPEPVRVHDFKIPELGKVAPYGVYDIAANHGWVSVGIDADTGAFAVESIRRWWLRLGQARYPNAKRLTITADCGGSNGPQPHPIARQDGQPMGFAGLWEGYRWPDGTVMRTFTIITTDANLMMAELSRQDSGDPRTRGVTDVVGRGRGWSGRHAAAGRRR